MVEAHAHAPERIPAELNVVLQAIGQAVSSGRLTDAMARAEAGLDEGLVHPLLFRLRGVKAEQAGRLDAAITDFEAALGLEGEDARLLNALGLCLARVGRAREGLARLDRAIALEGDVAVFHYNRGWALEVLGDVVGARSSYETAARLDPKDARTLGALAALAARRADWDEARLWSARARALDADQPGAILALARAELSDGDAEGARGRLESLLAKAQVSPHERAVTLNALGDSLDRLDQPQAAFAAYAEGASLLAGLYSARDRNALSTATLAERLAEDVRLSPAEAWTRPKTPATPVAKNHVFLLGFPRSGTTMLGQALAGHPKVETLDEKQTLADAAQVFTFPEDGLARLIAADEAELEPLREAYWHRVREGGGAPDGKIFVDKLPMNTLGLPLIRTLFPDAKVIFLRRDPRDVVLSCLRRQFVLDATTVELTRPDTAARLYDRVMRLMEVGRERLGLTLREQSYEDLVRNFAPEMRALCAFVGIDFTPAMADFAGRAGLVATPSAAQIARGLNDDSVGAWRRYREPLAPVMDVLSPWVARFRYEAE